MMSTCFPKNRMQGSKSFRSMDAETVTSFMEKGIMTVPIWMEKGPGELRTGFIVILIIQGPWFLAQLMMESLHRPFPS